MEKIKLIGRGSGLSLLQIEIVKQKINALFPGIHTEVMVSNSRGDALQNIPLHTMEGTDFFTKEISEAIQSGKADIAVHSLKDMSGEHFFGSNTFAVIDRDDTRDVAIFNNYIEQKIKSGNTITVGTCSPRREEMAAGFLKKALPQLCGEINIEIKPIRGNVETRLEKLSRGEYDGTLLATAGLNRLLRSEKEAVRVKSLLAGKKMMLLPLTECVPAPCQGAIVAEAHPSNKKATAILEKINNKNLFADCVAEKKEALKYGAGCMQKFGVTTLTTKHERYLYAAGKDAEGAELTRWTPIPDVVTNNLFSSTQVMKDFFRYEPIETKADINSSAVFVANYKAVQYGSTDLLQLNGPSQGTIDSSSAGDKQKIIIVSGTKTWFELARQGYWVTASADALGYEFLLPSLQMPLLNIKGDDICIITHESAAERWRKKGYEAIGTYRLVPAHNQSVIYSITAADSIFWSSYSQFEFYGKYARPHAKHMCSGGETAELLKQAGIEPILFPTIKAFEQWRKFSIRSHSAA